MAFRPLWSHTCTKIYRIRNNYNNTAFDTKQNNQIIYGEKHSFLTSHYYIILSLFVMFWGSLDLCCGIIDF